MLSDMSDLIFLFLAAANIGFGWTIGRFVGRMVTSAFANLFRDGLSEKASEYVGLHQRTKK